MGIAQQIVSLLQGFRMRTEGKTVVLRDQPDASRELDVDIVPII